MGTTPDDGSQLERRSVLYATLASGLILLQQVGSKAARDALFLTHFPARELPKIMAGAALVSLVVVLLSARVMARIGPVRLLPAALLVNAALFAGEAALSRSAPGPTALVLYLHVAALGSVLVSGFWSLVTERFDPHRARRYVGRIGVGATLGGACGGLAADAAMRLLSVHGLLAWLGVTSAFAALAVARVGRAPMAPPSTRGALAPGPLEILRTTPYLGLLGALAALGALWAALLDYAFKSEVSTVVRNSDDLIRFFGWFYTGTGLLTFFVQALFGEHMLKRRGIGVTVAVLPTFVAGFALVAGVVDVFLVLVVLRMLESVLANSLHRASYELFFTPLPRALKRPTKTLVDVAATRIGDAIGSALVLVGLAMIPDLPARVPILGAAVAAALAFVLVPRLHRGYVDALTKALRGGTIRLDESEAGLDALTQRTLAESTQHVDREKLLQEIEAFRRDQQAGDFGPPKPRPSKLSNTVPSAAPSSPRSLEARFAATLDPVVSTALILVSRDVTKIRRLLERPLDPELASFVLPLLANKALSKDVERSLEAMGSRIVGLLTDGLHDERLSRPARARIARLLGGLASARAREGLFEGLVDGPVALRLECARAIAVQANAHPSLAPSRARIFEAVASALANEHDLLDVRASTPPISADSANDDATATLDPRVRISLALVAATLDPENVNLAARALGTRDPSLRGTALEYLENVLEEPAKGALLRILSAPAAVVNRRSERELVEALHRTKG